MLCSAFYRSLLPGRRGIIYPAVSFCSHGQLLRSWIILPTMIYRTLSLTKSLYNNLALYNPPPISSLFGTKFFFFIFHRVHKSKLWVTLLFMVKYGNITTPPSD